MGGRKMLDIQIIRRKVSYGYEINIKIDGKLLTEAVVINGRLTKKRRAVSFLNMADAEKYVEGMLKEMME